MFGSKSERTRSRVFYAKMYAKRCIVTYTFYYGTVCWIRIRRLAIEHFIQCKTPGKPYGVCVYVNILRGASFKTTLQYNDTLRSLSLSLGLVRRARCARCRRKRARERTCNLLSLHI